MANAFSVSCPTCEARKNQKCVYVWPTNSNGFSQIRHDRLSEFTKAQMDRAGQPTKKPHTARSTKALLKEKVFRRQQREARDRKENAAGVNRSAALEANGRAIIDEHTQLRAWLLENADIFQGDPS